MSALGPQKHSLSTRASAHFWTNNERTATLKSYEGFSLTKYILRKRCIFIGLSYGKLS